jgi:hypothetical protein
VERFVPVCCFVRYAGCDRAGLQQEFTDRADADAVRVYAVRVGSVV